MMWWLLVGAILPVPFWFLAKKWPRSWIRFVNIPVLLTGASYIPPGTGYVLLSFLAHPWVSEFTPTASTIRPGSSSDLFSSTGCGGIASGGGQKFVLEKLQLC